MKNYLNIFKMLSDRNRLRILLMLKIRPMCVCEIAEVLNIALSTISAHLRFMKDTDLIADEKEGRWITYSLIGNNDFFNELLESLEKRLENDEQLLHDRRVVSEITREICTTKLKEKQNRVQR